MNTGIKIFLITDMFSDNQFKVKFTHPRKTFKKFLVLLLCCCFVHLDLAL